MTIDYRSIAEKCDSQTLKTIIEPTTRESWDDWKNSQVVIEKAGRRKHDDQRA